MDPVWHPLLMALETAVVLLAFFVLILGGSVLAVRVAFRARDPRGVRGAHRD